METRIFLLLISPLVSLAGPREATNTYDANLTTGAIAFQRSVIARSAKSSRLQISREARRQAYLLAEANEAAARQQILARLLAAKTPDEVDAATAELHDRWLAAKDSILALKAAAESEDVAPATPATD